MILSRSGLMYRHVAAWLEINWEFRAAVSINFGWRVEPSNANFCALLSCVESGMIEQQRSFFRAIVVRSLVNLDSGILCLCELRTHWPKKGTP